MTKKEILKLVISVLIAALTALAAGLGLSSCNVTRTVTTRSEAWQRGDTSVVIQTKTVGPSNRTTAHENFINPSNQPLTPLIELRGLSPRDVR